jgi:Cu+-exporting ATPase
VNDVLNKTTTQNRAEAATSCFHCGDTCLDATFAREEKVFCCQGCLVVHDLLAENGLEHFYDLSQHPGVRNQSASSRREQWAFLNEPALQQRLLDFADGKIGRVTFRIPTIHCIACVWLLENLFRLNPGIGASQVNFLKREVAITFRPQEISLGELVTLLASIGYEPVLTLGELEKKKSNPARKQQWIQIGVAGFAFGNIMLFSMPTYFGLDSFNGPIFHHLFSYLSLALALPVVVLSAADYWKSALLSVRQRILTLEIPIALGLAALYARSAFEVFANRGTGYLDSLVGLVFFLLCGRAFQQKTNERIVFDCDYKSFFPLSVTRRNAEKEETVSLSQLVVGDHILLRNTELIPADSKLVQGDALIDYSFVTGESAPVAKSQGDYLYAGGKQTGAAIEAEILKPVSQSYLTSLWNHETFQKNRDDNLNTLTNLYSQRFTFIVIVVAIAAALFWIICGQPLRAAKAFTSVLIVACPCALALAAPFTLGTAQRILVSFGFFSRNGSVIERMARVDSIVFDKTGTLTAADFSGISFEGDPLSVAEEQWVYSLAQQSTHPLSARLATAFRGKYRPEKVASFRETPGAGIEGSIDGHEIKLGRKSWIETSGDLEVKDAAFPALGSTISLDINGKARGRFVLANFLRPGIDSLTQKLSAQYDIALLSGDNESDRERFWHLFGSDEQMHFNQKPLDKLNFIRDLSATGKVVMMVGDGLNDAGALQQSDVGVAVVEKVGTFSPASDVILEASQVTRLHEILTFARKSVRIIRLSFGISAAYNLVGVSIAAAGILSPIICAILMPLSSLSVMLFACGMTAWAGRKLNAESNLERPESESTKRPIRISNLELASEFGFRTSDFPKP